MPVPARGGAEGSSEQVVSFVRRLIERGRLRPGDRLPAERALATRIGVSRPTVRAGLHSLAALGVVHSKHGSGTYIPDGPPALRTEPLSFLAALPCPLRSGNSPVTTSTSSYFRPACLPGTFRVYPGLG